MMSMMFFWAQSRFPETSWTRSSIGGANMRHDKIQWIRDQSHEDGLNLLYDEVAVILATGGGVGVFSDDEVDYVFAASDEWDRD